MHLALRSFEVYNDDENGQQVVIALVEGDEQRVAGFYNSAMTKRPQLAKVDRLKSENYTGDVMPSWQYGALNTSSQMNRGHLYCIFLFIPDLWHDSLQIGNDY